MPWAPKTRRPPFTGQRNRDRHSHTPTQRGYGHDWQAHERDRLFREIISARPEWWICRLCLDRPAHMWTDKEGRSHGLLDHGIPPGRIFRVGSPKYMWLHREVKNLLPACKRCNNKKGDRLPNELSEQMRVNLMAALNETDLNWRDLLERHTAQR